MKGSCFWMFLSVFISSHLSVVLSQDLPSFPTREDGIRTGLFSNLEGFANNQIFKTVQVDSQVTCVTTCVEEPKCQSVNYEIEGYPRHLCELSARRFISKDELDIEERPDYVHIYAIKENVTPHPCGKSRCRNGARCVLADNARQYRCICNTFNKGGNCASWTVDVQSCLDIYTKTNYRKSMEYTFIIDGKKRKIYCHMSDDICGSRGWTLVMKIDGSKRTFSYRRRLWLSKKPYRQSAGKTGFDNRQTKMPSYWAMPFQSLCVGMKVGNNLNWVYIPYPASSLYDVIANNTYTNVTIGREKWMSLIGGSALQDNCNAEGFNVVNRVRIGILANQEPDCLTPDSWIAFGLNYWAGNMTCGNFCRLGRCGNETKIIPAFGYILIK